MQNWRERIQRHLHILARIDDKHIAGARHEPALYGGRNFVAAGFSVGVFYLFAAILAWQLGGLPAATLALMRGTAWAFALCFAAITVVS